MFGNIEKLETNITTNRTRRGNFRIIKDSYWPNISVLNLAFKRIDKTTIGQFKIGLNLMKGRDIKLIDWENRAWIGNIITPEIEIVSDYRNQDADVSFEFMGELLDPAEITEDFENEYWGEL